MKKLLLLLFLPTLSFADRLGSLRSNADVLLTTQAVAGSMSPGATYYIQVRDTLQSGATFYVSSGAVSGLLSVATATVNGQLNVGGPITGNGAYLSNVPIMSPLLTAPFPGPTPGYLSITEYYNTATGATGGFRVNGTQTLSRNGTTIILGNAGSGVGASSTMCLGDSTCSNLDAGGIRSTIVGSVAAQADMAEDNTCVGYNACGDNTTNRQTMVGAFAGASLTTGNENTAIGWDTMPIATTAIANVCIGNNACDLLTTGLENMVVGNTAGADITSGQRNVCMGGGTSSVQSCTGIVTGSSNTAVGNGSLGNILYAGTESGNTTVGYKAAVGLGVNNSVAIGMNAVATSSYTMMLGGTGNDGLRVIMTTMTVSSGSVTGQLTAGTYQGGSLSTCGDATHALSWSGGSFGCQSITGTGSGGGASTLAVTVGPVRSSPTSDILFNPNQMSGSISASSITISLLSSSVTLQGNNLSDTYLTNSSATATYQNKNNALTLGSFSATQPILYNNTTGDISATLISLSTGVVGNLPVTNLNSGTGATSSTFWRGDGTWVSSSTFGTGGSGMSAGATYYIQVRDTLQSGATFYVSSGTIADQLNIGDGVHDGLVQYYFGSDLYTIIGSSVAGTEGLCAVASSSRTIRWQTCGTGTGGGDNLGSHIATMTVTGLYGAVFSTVTVSSNTYLPGTTFYANGMMKQSISTATYESVYADFTTSTMTVSWFLLDGAYGTSGQVLTSGGSGAKPTWETPGASSGDNLGSGVGSYGVATTTGGFTGAGGVNVTYGITVGSLTINNVGGIEMPSAYIRLSTLTAVGANGIGVTYGMVAGSVTVNDLSASQWVKTDANKKLASATNVATTGISYDGGGSALTAGSTRYVTIPYGATITGWTLTADTTGSMVIDVKKCAGYDCNPTTSIAGTEIPTLSSVWSNQDASLSSWTTSVSSGDKISFVLNSVSTISSANLVIHMNKD